MNVNEREYHESINSERLYWKHKYFEEIYDVEYADQTVRIDKEIQSQYPLEKLA